MTAGEPGTTTTVVLRCSDDPWFLLPVLPLADGGRARRIGARVGVDDLLSIVLTSSGPLLGISFELAERRGGIDHATDPRLGRILVDGRTVRLGLVSTVQRSLTFTALSAEAEERLIRALRRGRKLQFCFAERAIEACLSTLARPLELALRSVCDPERIPLERWLAS
jgi:hypothetical protein